MSAPQPGERAPAFTLPIAGGGVATLDPPHGWIVLYFYPKADTSGCTRQGLDFQAALPDFQALGASVIGVSPDKTPALERFAAKHGLHFPLAADPETAVLQAYGVWVEKSMYGRRYHGVERSTFLIAPDGIIRQAWRKVRVPGHVSLVLNVLRDDVPG